MFVWVQKETDGNKTWLNFETSNWITKEDPGFVDSDKKNFSLKKNSFVFKKIPSFKEIPFQKIGLYENPDFSTSKKTNGLLSMFQEIDR